MKTYNWDAGFETFFDKEESGRPYFDVVVGSGKPQRVYPESKAELKKCRDNVSKFGLNRPLGSYYPEGIR